jgi:hypothetical protein
MKNLLISGLIGLAFMVGTFCIGWKLAPVPPPPIKQAPVLAQNTAPAKPDPIGPEALKKTSETMMMLNQAIETREKNVAAREEKARQREEELNAERAALDRSHERFRILFGEFQQRLQLVEANQLDELQKQAGLYAAMGTDQSIDLIRAMDDGAMTRLFSVMDIKPLGKLVAAWKTKYPTDTERLLRALDGMAQVMPKEKIALSTTATAPGSGSSNSPAPADASAPAANQTPDASAPDTTSAPSANTNAADTTPNPPAPDSTPAADSSSTSTPSSPSTPASPPAPASPPTPGSPSTPASAPPADSAPAPISTAAAN